MSSNRHDWRWMVPPVATYDGNAHRYCWTCGDGPLGWWAARFGKCEADDEQ